MSICFFATDLHGITERYNKLFSQILIEEPEAVFLGGDLLPSGLFALTNNENIVGHSTLSLTYTTPENFLKGILSVVVKSNEDKNIFENLIEKLFNNGEE